MKKKYAVAIVLEKQNPAVTSTRMLHTEVEAASPDEARGKAIGDAAIQFPEFKISLHHVLSLTGEAAMPAGEKPGGVEWMPESWYKNPLWICENGHYSRVVLKSEALGRDACMKCGAKLAGVVGGSDFDIAPAHPAGGDVEFDEEAALDLWDNRDHGPFRERLRRYVRQIYTTFKPAPQPRVEVADEVISEWSKNFQFDPDDLKSLRWSGGKSITRTIRAALEHFSPARDEEREWRSLGNPPEHPVEQLHSIRVLGILEDGRHVFAHYRPFYQGRDGGDKSLWVCEGSGLATKPTHWMPLPVPPPESRAGGASGEKA